MAFGPITSWQIDGETMKTVADFIYFFAPKSLHLHHLVTAAMKLKDTSWKKSYGQPRQHIKKHRRYFANKGLSSSSVFPVVMYGRESWTIKKAECWRIYAFELWCWRRLLRVSCTARGSNQSILKEISPEYLLEGLMLKLKLKYFGHLMWRTDSLEKTLIGERLKAGGEGDDKRLDGWVASLTQRTWVWVSSGSLWWTGKPGVLQSMGSQRIRHNWATELNWTTENIKHGVIVGDKGEGVSFLTSDFLELATLNCSLGWHKGLATQRALKVEG